jgi:hypothetical protein
MRAECILPQDEFFVDACSLSLSRRILWFGNWRRIRWIWVNWQKRDAYIWLNDSFVLIYCSVAKSRTKSCISLEFLPYQSSIHLQKRWKCPMMSMCLTGFCQVMVRSPCLLLQICHLILCYPHCRLCFWLQVRSSSCRISSQDVILAQRLTILLLRCSIKSSRFARTEEVNFIDLPVWCRGLLEKIRKRYAPTLSKMAISFGGMT